MTERIFPKTMGKSILLFIFSQFSIMAILYHESVPSNKILGVLIMPIFLILFFIIYGGDDPQLTGFFFYLFGFLMATSIETSIFVRILIFVALPIIWFFMYSNLKKVRWVLLLERIPTMNKIALSLLVMGALISLAWINYKLLTISKVSLFGSAIFISLSVTLFIVLYKLGRACQNKITKNKIIKLTPWLYILLLYIPFISTTKIDFLVGFPGAVVAPLIWTFLLILMLKYPPKTQGN